MSTIELNGHCFVTDNQILWLRLPREGSPPKWQPNKRYKVGDVIIPVTEDSDLDQFMFQCVGFLQKSGSSEPSFNPLPGATTEDGSMVWVARDRTQARPKLNYREYQLIDETVNIQ